MYSKFFQSLERNVVGGIPNNRQVINHLVEFEKRIGAERESVIGCQECGTSFDINSSGVCPSCSKVYDLEMFDFVITKFE